VKQPIWLLIPLLVYSTACTKEQAYVKPLTPVRVQAVETATTEDGPRYSASIEPLSRNDVAFRLGGYVEEILTVPGENGGTRLVQEGDLVTRGSTLVRLRQTDYKTKVDQATSQLDQANAAVQQTEFGIKQAQVGRDKAKLDFDRATALFKTQSLTKTDLDGATAQLDNAQAVLDGAQTQLVLARARVAGAQAVVDEANLAVKDSSLTSPASGVVIKRLVEVGSLVGPGSPAFVLADIATLKAVFGAPDVLLAHLPMGTTVALSADAVPGVVFSGRVTSIAPSADPRSRVFDVEVTFANPNLRLKPGMIASVQLPVAHKIGPVPVVPMSAIVRSKSKQGGYEVFVVDEQGGKAVSRARDVSLGGALNNQIIVNDGVRPGERIIVTGAALVNDGDTVEIVP
jgi:multidrug efflux system membrane fusion protein